ncbi:MAG TPA: S-adenosylmethionine:tRNA ribosyltransferase-isomerase, partial [Pirellulales bacterium]
MSELDSYDYELPRALIAQDPLANRADARLLIVNRAGGSIEHRYIRDLPQILRSGDLLILNDTRVVPARLVGYRTATSGHWEGLFLRSDHDGLWLL